ncbi:MAG TPA: alpha/beta fold hydrolase [Solirubrobacteraceae bacterium]|nr:alpha/beta fold hydrolase [Solirubrobacteraceae bacterium]
MITTTLREQVLEGVPVTERRLTIAGASTVVLEGGKGPPLLLLHGPAGNGAHWARVLGPLATTHRVIAPDLPGHGGTDAPEPLDASTVLTWLAELVDRTCDEPPVIVGYALGGAIAARFAARHGDRVSALVLAGALGLRAFEPEPGFGAALHAFVTDPTPESHDDVWRHCALDLDGFRRDMGERWAPFAAYNVDRARTPGLQAARDALMAQFGMPAIPAEELDAIAVPVSLIWGRADPATPVSVAERESARRGWALHVVDGAAADPHLERPAEFTAALRRALVAPPAAAMRPRDEGFAEATLLWNADIETTPAYVVQATGVDDVVEALAFAREAGLRVAVRGGGHNIAGRAIAPGGLTIDMSRLREVTVDPAGRTATVQPGCLLADVDAATQRHGLALPLGFLSEVGVAGLTLGGGFGYLTRRFGWTVDNLLEVEIVTADGTVRRASRDEHADLFWAVRGAGQRLGVVTELRFRLHEVGPQVFGGLIALPFERAAEIQAAHRELTETAPRELAVWFNFVRAPAAPFVPPQWHGERICALAVCYSGDLARAGDALAPIRALGEPAFDLLREQPYTEVQSFLDPTEPKGEHYYWRTEYLAELSDAFLETTRELAAGCPIPQAQIGTLHLGGALNEHAGDDGAVGNRDARYVCGLLGAWGPGEPRAEEYREWVRAGWERLRPFGTGSSYVNFQSADEGGDRVRESYGGNLGRLERILRAYDPGGLFSIRDS